MKTRNGFVSNSSSSSFIIYGGVIEDISRKMLNTVIEDFEDWSDEVTKTEKKENKELHNKWRANLKTALKRRDIKDCKIGITMPSCNYDTYLFYKDDNLYITTCNNHSWNIGYARDYEDSNEYDRIYGIIKSNFFYNVRNKMIHSYETFVDVEKEKCSECTEYYGNYVVDLKGNRICASCYKGKLGPTKEAIEEKMLDELRKKGVTNPILGLELKDY